MLSPTSHRRADAPYLSYRRRRVRVRCPVAVSRRAGAAPRQISLSFRALICRRRSGTFTLTSRTSIWADRADSAVAERFARSLAPATGARAARASRNVGAAETRIVFRRARPSATRRSDPKAIASTCGQASCTITSSAPRRRVLRHANDPSAPSARDLPRRADRRRRRGRCPPCRSSTGRAFAWRGMHLDVVAPLHAEGVRQEVHRSPRAAQNELVPLASDRRPGLAHRDQEISAAHRRRRLARQHDRRPPACATRRSATFDHKPHGGFYTQDDVREIVAYARERFVTRRPRDRDAGPLAGGDRRLPELGNFGDTIKPWTMWGVTQLHPQSVGHDDRVHAGRAHRGDGALSRASSSTSAATKRPSTSGRRARARRRRRIRRALGDRRTENELQSWFTTQMDAFLTVARTPARRLGRDPRGRPRAERGR